jgi:hypothetical protein
MNLLKELREEAIAKADKKYPKPPLYLMSW